jgi:hypothetical protein
MIVKKTEWHSVASEFTYDIDDEAIIEEFGSVQRFKEIISHQEQETWGGLSPEGEAPTDEETDKFWDFLSEHDYERYDDWWTDRKGGYDVTVRYDEEDK